MAVQNQFGNTMDHSAWVVNVSLISVGNQKAPSCENNPAADHSRALKIINKTITDTKHYA